MSNNQAIQGAVKFYDDGKGFGFIRGDDGQDHFFHIRGVLDAAAVLEKGDRVEFVVGVNTHTGRPLATNVRRVS